MKLRSGEWNAMKYQVFHNQVEEVKCTARLNTVYKHWRYREKNRGQNNKIPNARYCPECEIVMNVSLGEVEEQIKNEDWQNTRCDECDRCFNGPGGLAIHKGIKHQAIKDEGD